MEDNNDCKTTYQSGECTLQEIGKELGGISSAAVKKQLSIAENKFRTLCNNKPLHQLDGEDLEQLNLNILKARKKVAANYGDILLDVEDVDKFYEKLYKQRYLTKGDIQYHQNEKEKWSLLKLKTTSCIEVQNVLLSDIEQNDNKFKAFQTGVNRYMFPRTRSNNKTEGSSNGKVET